MFGNEVVVNKDFILSRISEEDIFRRYLGIEPSLVGNYMNPLRDDDDPGCSFYVDGRGVWKFHDFAAGLNWDCFNVVEYAYNLNFKEAMIKIAGDFGLIDSKNANYTTIAKITRAPRRKTELRIKRRAWTKADYAYWAQFGITPERLEWFKVVPVSHVWFLEGAILRQAYYYKDGDPAYAYHFGKAYDYKIYMPLRPKGKFIHSRGDIIQGYEQLPDVGKNLLITKSFKDVMALDGYREYNLSAIAPMSETVLLSQEAFVDLYNRFDYIATLFDFDKAGVRLMRKYESTYKLSYFMFGKAYKKKGVKDFADHRKIFGESETRKLVEQYALEQTIDDSSAF